MIIIYICYSFIVMTNKLIRSLNLKYSGGICKYRFQKRYIMVVFNLKLFGANAKLCGFDSF